MHQVIDRRMASGKISRVPGLGGGFGKQTGNNVIETTQNGGNGDRDGEDEDEEEEYLETSAVAGSRRELERRLVRKIDLRLCTIAGILCSLNLLGEF